MRRDLNELVRYTVIWLVVLVWLGLGLVYQPTPGGPYTDFMRRAFEIVLAVVVPLVSAFFVVSWIVVLRGRRP
jgi:hypothetical protein